MLILELHGCITYTKAFNTINRASFYIVKRKNYYTRYDNAKSTITSAMHTCTIERIF